MGRPGGAMSPVVMSTTASGSAPAVAVTTGVPQAIAWIASMPTGSYGAVLTSRSAERSSAGRSRAATGPVNTSRSRTRSALAILIRSW